MRIRTAVVCSLAVVATWFVADTASALEVGPVSLPVQLPPAVTVAVPPTVTVGPIALPVSNVAPGLGATVNVSPQNGVGASVSLPSSIGPLPVLPGAPHSVQVGLGSGGAHVTVPPGLPSTSGAPSGATPASLSSATRRSTLGSHSPAAARANGRDGLVNASNGPTAPSATRAALPSPVVESPSGAVNASLQHRSAGGVWSLLHDLASAHGLWIVLLLIVAVARFAAGGLLHDAVRRRSRLSST